MKQSLAFRVLAPLLLVSSLLTTLAAEDLTTWNKRMPITFSGYNPPVAETLTNFPAVVILSNSTAGAGFNYNDFLSPPYGDLRFATSPDGTTPLNFEVEKWDTTSNSCVWVQVPALTDATTTVWAFWGKAGTNAPVCVTNRTTWSNAYLGVWHMATNTSLMIDSSTNRRGTATAVGTVSFVTTGVVAGADDFTPQSYLAPSNTFPTLSGSYTLSAWVNMRSNAIAHMGIMGSYNGTGGFIFGLTNTTRCLAFYDTAWRSTGFHMPTGTWTHVAYTRNSTNGVFL